MEIVVKENEEAAIVIWYQGGAYQRSGRQTVGIDDRQWVTHFKNKRIDFPDGAYYWGHYDMTLEDAISDAKERNL